MLNKRWLDSTFSSSAKQPIVSEVPFLFLFWKKPYTMREKKLVLTCAKFT